MAVAPVSVVVADSIAAAVAMVAAVVVAVMAVVAVVAVTTGGRRSCHRYSGNLSVHPHQRCRSQTRHTTNSAFPMSRGSQGHLGSREPESWYLSCCLRYR